MTIQMISMGFWPGQYRVWYRHLNLQVWLWSPVNSLFLYPPLHLPSVPHCRRRRIWRWRTRSRKQKQKRVVRRQLAIFLLLNSLKTPDKRKLKQWDLNNEIKLDNSVMIVRTREAKLWLCSKGAEMTYSRTDFSWRRAFVISSYKFLEKHKHAINNKEQLSV